jgi:acyl-CoA thioester hydrolase
MEEQFSKVITITLGGYRCKPSSSSLAYYDYGATLRMLFFSEHGLSRKKLEELQIGPILFREEALFKREIKLEDQITVDVLLLCATANYSRWSFRHTFTKSDGHYCSSHHHRRCVDGPR